MGDPQAPVHVEEFSDFQCPYCRRFTEEVEPSLVEEYVAPGKVYFTYRQFPILGTASVRAAEVSLCAREQGAFWPYHDVLFANQDETIRSRSPKSVWRTSPKRSGSTEENSAAV